MKKLLYGVIILNLLTSLFINPSSVAAASTSVVISEVYQKGQQEAVEITNISSADIDIRGWTLSFVNTEAEDEPTLAYTFDKGIKAQSSVTLKTANADITASADAVWPGNILLVDGGSLFLKDNSGSVIDLLGWGTNAIYSEGQAAQQPASGVSLSRTNNVDTDNNRLDFASSTPNFVAGGFVEIIDDLCSNIEGVQAEVPSGYTRLNDGTCEATASDTDPEVELMPPYINELLPDPTQLSDDEGEFIELYNPNGVTFALEGYQLKVGSKIFTFTTQTIASQAYFVIYRLESKLTLSNSGSQVQLLAPQTGEKVDETPAYGPIDPDQAYARFSDGWKYTDEPTPGAANAFKELSEEEVNAAATIIKTTECPAGKYRNPATNRCKNFESAVATATACDEDEYRHPETKRCRKVLAASVVTPCKPGYERNHTTNRCRRIPSAAAALQPCKLGYERNAETNRCRKIGAAQNLITPAAIQPNGLNFWLAGAGVAAVGGYGIWEWRREIWGLTRKLFPQSGGE